jgi:3-phenylpropionate/cinnamic acid dioxygenase small subunit
MSTTETLVRELADRAELTELVARHAKWVDDRAWEDAARIATADITARARGLEVTGITAFAALAREVHEVYESTRHSTSNVIIDLDGDTATVQARVLAVFRTGAESMSLTAADYRFGARRTESGWRIAAFDVTPTSRTAAIEQTL